MVSSPPPTSASAPSAASATSWPADPLSPISSSLYGSAASSSRASSSETARRENDWPSLTIFCITEDSFFRSSGVNGVSTSKS